MVLVRLGWPPLNRQREVGWHPVGSVRPIDQPRRNATRRCPSGGEGPVVLHFLHTLPPYRRIHLHTAFVVDSITWEGPNSPGSVLSRFWRVEYGVSGGGNCENYLPPMFNAIGKLKNSLSDALIKRGLHDILFPKHICIQAMAPCMLSLAVPFLCFPDSPGGVYRKFHPFDNCCEKPSPET